MSYWAKGQSQCLCPYYNRENKLSIKCDGELVRFDSPEARQEYKLHHCWKAVPLNCDRYMVHHERVLAGEEERAKPRQNADEYLKNYQRKLMYDARQRGVYYASVEYQKDYKKRKKEEKQKWLEGKI